MLEDGKSYLPVLRNPFARVGEKESPKRKPSDVQAESSSAAVKRAEAEAQLASNDDDGDATEYRSFSTASDLELFYDLFFVANLTVFTYIHEINDGESLRQYIGYFGLLWFTWYQVSLYDVRFSMDSLVERVCKGLQLLVMIGFAICGPEFKVGEEENRDEKLVSLKYFQGFSIILMISRLVLVVQYVQAACFARRRRFAGVAIPLVLIALAYLVTAALYFGIFWIFRSLKFSLEDHSTHSYILWYVTAACETALVLSVSCFYKKIGFEGTHLAERMSLLTLIMLGEGAIATAKACQYITFAEGAFSLNHNVLKEIACAVLNLYFLHMIYFDWLNEEWFGVIRQQIWSTLHFPFHLAIVLAVEGASQCITWNAAVRRSNQLLDEFQYWVEILFNSNAPTAADFRNAATALNESASTLLTRQLERSSGFLDTMQGVSYLHQAREAAIPAIMNGVEKREAASNALWWLHSVLYATIFKIAAFHPPELEGEWREVREYLEKPIDFSSYSDGHWRETANNNLEQSWRVFSLTYTYFFAATGLVVIVATALAWVNRGPQAVVFRFRMLVMGLIGLGLALLSTMVLTDAVNNFVLGPWMLPTVTLALFAIVLMNNVRLPALKSSVKKPSLTEKKN